MCYLQWIKKLQKRTCKILLRHLLFEWQPAGSLSLKPLMSHRWRGLRRRFTHFIHVQCLREALQCKFYICCSVLKHSLNNMKALDKFWVLKECFQIERYYSTLQLQCLCEKVSVRKIHARMMCQGTWEITIGVSAPLYFSMPDDTAVTVLYSCS